jgi:L-threonylcarbamoyladenylate synthase
MKYRHYAPDAPLVLLEGEREDVLAFLQEEQDRRRCAVLCYDEEVPLLDRAILLPIGGADDLASHAKLLFRHLREADRKHPDIIYAHLPPKEGLGLALYNRMIRAAAHTIEHIPSQSEQKGRL